MTDAPIYTRQVGPVGYLLINRADKKNAMSVEMWRAIPDLLGDLASSESLRVLIVGSAIPGVFSAGADIAEFKQLAKDPDFQRRNIEAVIAAQAAIADFSLPTLARIEGACVGGGCALALACDIRIASSKTRMGITPANLGLIYPLEDTARLIGAVGLQAAKRLLFTASLVDAQEALSMGLVSQLVAPDDLTAETDALAQVICGRSPWSLRQMKQHLQRVMAGQHHEDEATINAFLSAYLQPDFEEGVDAFFQGRKPDFDKL